MLGWVVLIAACVLMYRIADMSGHSGAVWSGVTFFLCLGCATLISMPFINIVIGLVLSYGAFFAYHLARGRAVD